MQRYLDDTKWNTEKIIEVDFSAIGNGSSMVYREARKGFIPNLIRRSWNVKTKHFPKLCKKLETHHTITNLAICFIENMIPFTENLVELIKSLPNLSHMEISYRSCPSYVQLLEVIFDCTQIKNLTINAQVFESTMSNTLEFLAKCKRPLRLCIEIKYHYTTFNHIPFPHIFEINPYMYVFVRQSNGYVYSPFTIEEWKEKLDMLGQRRIKSARSTIE